jgi:hypothetical protein
VTVTTDPAVAGVSIQTGSNGSYSASLPIGIYTLTFEKTHFESATGSVSVLAAQAATKDVALEPTSAVVVNAGADQHSDPSGVVTLSVAVEPVDGSTVTGYEWTQTASVTATIENADTATATVTLGDAAAYKAELFSHLNALDRFMVQAINPHSLEVAEMVTFKVTVTTSSGTYTDEVDVIADLPYAVNGGLQNVPKGIPVLLHGKDQATYDWSLTTTPGGSSATLNDASSQNPWFTPDVTGQYTLTEADSAATIDVYAGTWAGVISGQDVDGRPLAANCTVCHNGTIAADKFTPWAASGHAEIFTDNLNTSTHYGEGCFSCHTVGYDTAVDNGGFDDASDYAAFLAAGLLNNPGDNWTTMLADYPNAAKLANIQCENCHGPNNPSGLHMASDPARISLSSDVCGACHGEPARHGRFQQWEESGHGNYELAIDEATVDNFGSTAAHCGRCHSGQGFLAWIEQGDLTKWIQGASGNADVTELAALGLTADTVHPQTCATCHTPHDVGTESGEPNDVNLRVQGSTAMLPAGFKALGVGNGALCMTCHNTRNGAHNDAMTDPVNDSAPHTAAQADVLMGENAFFVTVGERSPHSYIENTCTTCHMVLTPPPADLSYNLSGTNHTFEPSHEICASCHGAFDGGSLEAATEALLEELKADIEAAIIDEITAQIDAGNTVTLVEAGEGGADVVIMDAATVTAVELTEYRGRLAMNVTVGGTNYGNVQLDGDTEVDGGTLIDSAAGQIIAKAAWNYFLIHGDDSHGVHNPSWTNAVLNGAIDALA